MRIAVITPAYNAAAFLADAVCSVLAQTHRDLSLVVVDDGSTDGTASVAAAFADPRVAVLRQPNAGVAAARNRGLAAAEADAVLFLDADDWLAPAALASLAAVLDAATGAVAAVGPYAGVAANGRVIRHRPWRPPAMPCDLLARLLAQNQFANGGHVLIRGSAARRAGCFLPGLIFGEDWEYFIRVALLGPYAFVPAPAPLLFLRSRADGAYRRLAADQAAFAPCMNAVFGNPDLLERFGAARLAALRRRAEAENAWIIGRELVRQGRAGEGRGWLACSVASAPSCRRLALLAAARLLPLLPQAWQGPFRAYDETGVGESRSR